MYLSIPVWVSIVYIDQETNLSRELKGILKTFLSLVERTSP